MTTRIYVGNLPLDIREKELDDIFYKVRDTGNALGFPPELPMMRCFHVYTSPGLQMLTHSQALEFHSLVYLKTVPCQHHTPTPLITRALCSTARSAPLTSRLPRDLLPSLSWSLVRALHSSMHCTMRQWLPCVYMTCGVDSGTYAVARQWCNAQGYKKCTIVIWSFAVMKQCHAWLFTQPLSPCMKFQQGWELGQINSGNRACVLVLAVMC